MRQLACALLAAMAAGWMAQAAETANDEFVLGVYSSDPQTETTFKRLQEAGINYVQSYGSAGSKPPTKLLDIAQQYNMKVMYDVAAKRLVRDNPAQAWLDMTTLIDQIKDHPALGMWYLWDEPDTDQLPVVRRLNDVIKSVSAKPTILVIHWRENWYDTRGYSDWWMADCYPVRGQPFPKAPLDHYTRYLQLAALANIPGTPLVGVMQACDCRCFKSMVKPEFQDTLRFPNLEEMRFMGFSSLALGVRGIFYYSYYHSHTETPEGLAYFNDSFKPSVAELRAFLDAVERPWDVTAGGYDLNINNKIILAYWKRDAGDFIVLGNDTPEARDIEVRLAGKGFPKNAKLIPWGPTAAGDHTLADDKLALKDVKPWETFIWKLEYPETTTE